MSYQKKEVLEMATKLGRLVNGGVVGFYAGGKTSEIMSKTIPDQLIEVVERHKKIQLGASLAQSFFPGASVAAMAAATASLWKMYYDINGVLGIKISENAGKSLTSAILTNMGSFGAQGVATFVSEGAKFIPFVGWIASAGISTATTTAIIYGAAYVYLNALTTMYEAEGKFNMDYLTSEFENNVNNEIISTFNIATLGHVDHGKTTLTAAISSVLSKRNQAKMYSYGYIDNAEEIDINGTKCYCSQIEYDSDIRRYVHSDMPNHSDYIKALVTGAIRLDGAIVVVSATDGPMPQTREHILLARQLNIHKLIVFLNKCDLVDDDDMLDLVQMEVQEILDQYEFEDDTPIIRGSALGTLTGDKKWEDTIDELIHICDDWFEEPERDIDKPFLMPIEDVFSIIGRGTVVTGRIETGIINVDDDVQILGLGSRLMSTVTGVEMFNKVLTQGEAGDNVGLLLKGIDKDEIIRGMVVTQSGVVKLHKKFIATVYILKKEEGGRSTPFGNKYRPQFYIRTMDCTGEITLPKGVEMVMPGDNVEIDVTLICEVALNPGLQIAIREGGCLVGLGVVTQLM